MEYRRYADGRSPRIVASASVQHIPIAGGAGAKSALVERLRAQIRSIEQAPVSLAPVSHAFPPAPGTEASRPTCAPFPHPSSPDLPAASGGGPLCGRVQDAGQPSTEEERPWRFGAAEIDQALPGGGLEPAGLHEIRPLSYRDQGAALGFALALLGRRLGQGAERDLFLWAATQASWRETGSPYGPGLRRFGIDAPRLIMVQARHSRDLAWALEEGLKSRALLALLGQIETAPSLGLRRLALAARHHHTPCLLVPGPKAVNLGPTLTRWRVAAAPSDPHAFDPAAPGRPRWHITLERCRWGRSGQNWTVEWSDDAYCFRVAAALADRETETRESSERAGSRGGLLRHSG